MARRFKTPKLPKGPKLTEPSEETLKLMARLIDDHYGFLAEAKIIVWMVNGTWKKEGETCEAECQLISGAARKETGAIFRISLNATVWNNANEKYRAYLLDNQLMRCCKGETKSGEPRWYKQGYALKAFPGMVSRYGLITEEMRQFDAAVKQTALPFDDEAGPKEAA